MDISKLLGQVTNQAGGGKGGLDGKSMAAGAAMGGMAGLFANSRTARQMKRKAGQAARRHGGMAGLALVGGLAYKAYSDHKVKQATSAAALPEPGNAPAGFITDESGVNSEAGTLVLRAMISAASADGTIDSDERAAIMAELDKSDLPKSAMGQIMMEMNSPASPADIAKDVKTPEQAVQVYTAAHLAISVDTDEERQFLTDLSTALDMPPSLVAQVDETIANF